MYFISVGVDFVTTEMVKNMGFTVASITSITFSLWYFLVVWSSVSSLKYCDSVSLSLK